MKKKIISFILIIIFIIIFFSGILKMNDIVLYELHSGKSVQDTEFVQEVKKILNKIKLKRNNIKNSGEQLVQKEDTEEKSKLSIYIYYIITSPTKEVGVYFNGRRYLLQEGDTVQDILTIKRIFRNSIEVRYRDNTYWISK